MKNNFPPFRVPHSAPRDGDGVRVLMKDGKWLVPPKKRPKLPPPPKEWTAEQRMVDRWISDTMTRTP